MNSVKLSYKSFEELNVLRLSIENNPKNKTQGTSFHIMIPTARKKLEAIAWAITYKMQRERDNREVKGK